MNLIFALSAAFGALGAGGLTLIPVSAFYFPLGAGAAGLVLFIIGLTMHGRTPWYAWLAGGLGLGSLILGLAAYSDYHQLNDQIQQLQDQLQRFQ
jgi:hypothetical protein